MFPFISIVFVSAKGQHDLVTVVVKNEYEPVFYQRGLMYGSAQMPWPLGFCNLCHLEKKGPGGLTWGEGTNSRSLVTRDIERRTHYFDILFPSMFMVDQG